MKDIFSKIKSRFINENGKARTIVIAVLAVVIVLVLLSVIFKDQIMWVYDQITQPIGPGGLPPNYYNAY